MTKLFFSDLDGTLLRDDHVFSDKTIELVKEIYASGSYLIPTTARTLKDLKQKAKLLNLDKLGGIIAASNGAQIYDLKKDVYISNKNLDKDILKIMFDRYYNKFFAKLAFYSEESMYVFKQGKNSRYGADVMNMNYYEIKSTDEIDEEISHISIVINSKSEKEDFFEEVNFLRAKFKNKYKIDTYRDRVIEIASHGVDKGYVVDAVKKYLKLDNNVITYGFGDGDNDLPLMKKVDVSVAMVNAIEKLKLACDYTTDFCNKEDGVANGIYDKIITKENENVDD